MTPINDLYSMQYRRFEDRPYVDLLDSTIARSDSIVTICGWCKKILMPDGRWAEVEEAINSLRLLDAGIPRLSHGICPPCSDDLLGSLDGHSADD